MEYETLPALTSAMYLCLRAENEPLMPADVLVYTRLLYESYHESRFGMIYAVMTMGKLIGTCSIAGLVKHASHRY